VTQKDYYEILGVDRAATPRQIKETYRRLAFEYHPDRNTGDASAAERMKVLNEAYAVLYDQEKRQRYDSFSRQYGFDARDRFRQGYSEEDIFRGSDINQIFEEMTRQFGFRNFNDLFREFYGPGFQAFEFRRPGVFGRGFIFTGFPRGAQGRRRMPSAGQPGLFTGLLGKLAGYLARRAFTGLDAGQAGDRYDAITISREDAQRGAKVSYVDRQTLRKIIVSVPPGVRDGQTIRLKGGVKNNIYNTVTGDLYLKVQFRKNLIEKAKELYGKLTG
jgi:DnaJ-class molecular chaperone